MDKEPLFSVTKKDLRIDTFRAGGKGGQGQNKKSSGVRITHVPSGAVGEARDQRQQLDNRKSAFHRMMETSTFQIWMKKRISEALGIEKQIEASVEKAIHPKNLLIEVKDEDGNWTEYKPSETE